MTTRNERIPQPAGDTRLFNALAYAGIAPFLLGIYLEFTQLAIVGVDGRFLFSAYSACILSFLCGIWWGAALNRHDHPHRVALVLLSNLVCLAAWVGLLLFRLPWGLSLLTLGFIFTRWAEPRLNPNIAGLYAYFRTRSRVSYIVIACHLVMLGLALARP